MTGRTSLTGQQRRAIDALSRARAPMTPRALALALETTRAGAAATAGSLVRRGLVERHQAAGLVVYRLTAEGRSSSPDRKRPMP